MTAQTETIPSSGVALVDFTASWCGPCRAVAPMIDELAQTYASRATVKKIDIDHNRDLALQMGVQSVPTLIVFVDGQEQNRFIGATSKSDLHAALENALA
ncbi:MAG: thioredoxin [Thermodesulfobacteriota bacterium]